MLDVYLRRGEGAYALLADALALHGFASPPPVARGPYGKPCFPDYPKLRFNLSHSGGLLLCALSDAPVGVDIEVVRPRGANLPRYCLTDSEYAAFLAAGGTWEEFYRFFTLKEAQCKRLGEALRDPKAWPVPPDCPHRSYGGKGFAAAVCAGEAPPDLLPL